MVYLMLQKWFKNWKRKAIAPSERIAFNKEQSQIVIKKAEEDHPGANGPVTREGINVACMHINLPIGVEELM